MDFEKFANSEWWLYGLAIFNGLIFLGGATVLAYKKFRKRR
jgi:hypothetical protein